MVITGVCEMFVPDGVGWGCSWVCCILWVYRRSLSWRFGGSLRDGYLIDDLSRSFHQETMVTGAVTVMLRTLDPTCAVRWIVV